MADSASTPAPSDASPAAPQAAAPSPAPAASPEPELSRVLRPRGYDALVRDLNGCTTVPAVFDYARQHHADLPFGGYRKGGAGDFRWVSYAEWALAVDAFAHGLAARLRLSSGSMLGIFSVNRIEWTVTDMASAVSGIVTVPFYDSLGAERVAMIINETEISTVVCSRDKVDMLLGIAPQCPSLRTLVQLPDDQGGDATSIVTAQHNVEIVSYTTVLNEGRAAQQAAAPFPRHDCTPDDLYTIIYTSGTSGRPKGAMISHKNLISGASGVLNHFRDVLVDREEVLLSFLPLAHVLERQIFLLELTKGAKVGFFSGQTSKIMDDLKLLKPTIFFGVPRLYNRIYDGVMARVNAMPFYKRWLFWLAYSLKDGSLSRPGPKSLADFCSPWDFVFKPIRMNTGGRVKLMVTGSAALNADVHRAMQVMFSCPVVQGYGMTEAYAVSVHDIDDATPGHCGPVMPNGELRLRSVPELSYAVSDAPHPRGEILISGPHVFGGYYKHPELTAEVMTADGWYCTGDIGEIIEGDRLRVIDRRREMFKLAQGEYLSAERLEGAYQRCPLVQQVFVYGDASRSFLVAVVVPEEAPLRRAVPSAGAEAPLEQLCATPAAREAVLRALGDVHAAESMTGLERIRTVHLEAMPFAVENGLLTPTSKLSRPAARKHYAQVIEALYQQGSGAPAAAST
eukprot:m51a1_g7303 hypothetical protein (681) ;mRNA; f:92149-94940